MQLLDNKGNLTEWGEAMADLLAAVEGKGEAELVAELAREWGEAEAAELVAVLTSEGTL
jgi:hypothetical protein